MIIDGKKIADEILVSLKNAMTGRAVRLMAVRIGDNPEIKKFIDIKKRAAESIGLTFSSYCASRSNDESEVLQVIDCLNRDKTVQGIFIELPIPQEYDQRKIINAIDPVKDVDVLTDVLQKRFYSGNFAILPPAVRALETVFKKHNINSKNISVAVFGQGFLVGKPITFWLNKQGAKVFPVDINTQDAAQYSRQADVVISAVGKPNLITASMVKDNAIVIDFGYPKGDVDFNPVSQKASLITPVPGGMGPLVVAAVLENLCNLDNFVA